MNGEGSIIRWVSALLALIVFVLLFTIQARSVASENETQWADEAFLPVIHKPPLPLPTPFSTPGQRKRYRLEYGIETDSRYIWMPVPKYWDGNGNQNMTIVSYLPYPSTRYMDGNGNEIAYWENLGQTLQTFQIVFDVEISFISYGISENREWSAYDMNSAIYQKNTKDTLWVQVSHPEIQDQTMAIVGGETNPYKKARLIHAWVSQHIQPPQTNQDPQDALSTLRNGYGDCASHANLFVALTRASGIPARNVSGIHNPYGSIIENGDWDEGTLHTHVWAEFYLPNYGWIQVDPTQSRMFADIPEPRVIYAKGNDIELGNGYPCTELGWFHMPHASNQKIQPGATPQPYYYCQTRGRKLFLHVIP